MSDIKLFRFSGNSAEELIGSTAHLEQKLHTLMERHLECFLGIRLVAGEHSTGKNHHGRIDTLGLDENGCPVILEYKRRSNENVINQGLYYLDWLLDHRAEFKLLVLERYGKAVADSLEWNGARVLCVAGDFTKFDLHAVAQIGRNIELIRYKFFSEAPAQGKLSKQLASMPPDIAGLWKETLEFIRGLGDDVTIKFLRHYAACSRLKNFACLHPLKGAVVLWLKLDPASLPLEPGFTQDVSGKGHLGTGNLEVRLHSEAELEKAIPLLERAYQES